MKQDPLVYPVGPSLTVFVFRVSILKEIRATPALYKQALTNPSGQQDDITAKLPIVTAMFFLVLCT